MRSPTRTSWDAFAGLPFTCTAPTSHASFPSLRLFTRRSRLSARSTRTLDANGDEGRLAKAVEQAANCLLLRELFADLLPKLGERRLALGFCTGELKDHELRYLARRIVDLEGIDDVVRLPTVDGLLIGLGKLRSRERIRNAPLLDGVMILRDEGVERHTGAPRRGHGVGAQPCSGDVHRIERGTDEN